MVHVGTASPNEIEVGIRMPWLVIWVDRSNITELDI
jgi:hypothetical protein